MFRDRIRDARTNRTKTVYTSDHSTLGGAIKLSEQHCYYRSVAYQGVQYRNVGFQLHPYGFYSGPTTGGGRAHLTSVTVGLEIGVGDGGQRGHLPHLPSRILENICPTIIM